MFSTSERSHLIDYHMLRKLIFIAFVWSLFIINSHAQDKDKITEKYYQLIEAPTAPEKWDAWRSELRVWKDSTLRFLQYRGENYQKRNTNGLPKPIPLFF